MTTVDTSDARKALAKTNDRPNIATLIDRQKPEIARALPKHMDPDRLARIALTVFRQTPALQQCSADSFLGALMTASQLGLEPGPLGHAYFVPFKGQVQFIIGYKGIIDLARRSGNIESLVAREVYRADKFEVAYGLDDRLLHEPNLFGERGPVVAVYAVAKYKGGGHTFIVLSRAEVEEHRKRSRAKDSGPWVTDWVAMARKTAIRVLAAFLPLSVEVATALATDERVYRGAVTRDDVDDAAVSVTPDHDDEVAEAEFVDEPDVDFATGEVRE